MQARQLLESAFNELLINGTERRLNNVKIVLNHENLTDFLSFFCRSIQVHLVVVAAEVEVMPIVWCEKEKRVD